MRAELEIPRPVIVRLGPSRAPDTAYNATTSSNGLAYEFATFSLIPAQQMLLEDGQEIRLGSRALAILTALVERAGEIVTKEELVAQVWPNTFVEEGNLRVHMNALRRALGDGQRGNRYIITIPGRGYRFVVPITYSDSSKRQASGPCAPAAERPGLPAQLTRMVGREHMVATLKAQLAKQHFVTLAGPGGIGKTTIALAAANALSKAYSDRAHFIDLSTLTDPQFVPATVASALGLEQRSGDPTGEVVAFLRSKRMLIILDSCEHVVFAAACLAERLRAAAPEVDVLATSREPLRAAGERVMRVAPLPVPPTSTALTAEEALAFSAVELFVERASAGASGYELSDRDAPIVADVCRKLDGIPLAIELAAARVDMLGVRVLCSQLDHRICLSMPGRRTACPRHQTLARMFDWSYQFLPDEEQLLLRRLSTFPADFTVEAVCAIMADSTLDAPQVINSMANLVSKSLVVADVVSTIVRYRLLDTTRRYARERLAESDTGEPIVSRNDKYYRCLTHQLEEHCSPSV
jgi:predicted ATPase/DNA-binding winged helix-turn-helix (wHTH) protein